MAWHTGELTWQTTALLEQLAEIEEWHEALGEAQERAVTPDEIRAIEKELALVGRAFWTIRMSCRVMRDLPAAELVPILDVHVRDRGSVEAWCAYVVAHRGPTIDPIWLRGYIDDHLTGRPREHEPIVHEAMVTVDARVITAGGKLLEVDTGRPVLF